MTRTLMIDHYDSFSYNIARYARMLGAEITVARHDAISLVDILALDPEKIILSPGPCSPAEASLAMQLLTEMPERWPILGICLGHQCIGAAFGGIIERARHPMHGRASTITHDGQGLFAGLPQKLDVGRYHSLIVRETSEMNRHLAVSARCPNGEIMGLRHKSLSIEAIQFHPESILTECGMEILGRFFQCFLPAESRKQHHASGAIPHEKLENRLWS